MTDDEIKAIVCAEVDAMESRLIIKDMLARLAARIAQRVGAYVETSSPQPDIVECDLKLSDGRLIMMDVRRQCSSHDRTTSCLACAML